MIITSEFEIKINEGNYYYYHNLGYDISIDDTIIIPISLLTSGSKRKIECKCDSCGIIKEVIFKNYMKYNNRWGEYKCRKCSESKRKKTLNMNYGVDYPIQNKEIKKRIFKN